MRPRYILRRGGGHITSSPLRRGGGHTDLFSRRFREGISFSKSVERSIPELPLSKPGAVLFALQNRALFEGRKGGKYAEKRGGRGVARKGGKKEKRTRKNRSAYHPTSRLWLPKWLALVKEREREREKKKGALRPSTCLPECLTFVETLFWCTRLPICLP